MLRNEDGCEGEAAGLVRGFPMGLFILLIHGFGIFCGHVC